MAPRSSAISANKKGPQRAPFLLADRVGFEPTEPLQARRISSAVPSTTRPPVRRRRYLSGQLMASSFGHSDFSAARAYCAQCSRYGRRHVQQTSAVHGPNLDQPGGLPTKRGRPGSDYPHASCCGPSAIKAIRTQDAGLDGLPIVSVLTRHTVLPTSSAISSAPV